VGLERETQIRIRNTFPFSIESKEKGVDEKNGARRRNAYYFKTIPRHGKILGKGASRMTLFDFSGKKIGEYSMKNAPVAGAVACPGLAPGVYILRQF
jgi:hypothetical protein